VSFDIESHSPSAYAEQNRKRQRCGTKECHQFVSVGAVAAWYRYASGAWNDFHVTVYQYAMQHGNGFDRLAQ